MSIISKLQELFGGKRVAKRPELPRVHCPLEKINPLMWKPDKNTQEGIENYKRYVRDLTIDGCGHLTIKPLAYKKDCAESEWHRMCDVVRKLMMEEYGKETGNELFYHLAWCSFRAVVKMDVAQDIYEFLKKNDIECHCDVYEDDLSSFDRYGIPICQDIEEYRKFKDDYEQNEVCERIRCGVELYGVAKEDQDGVRFYIGNGEIIKFNLLHPEDLSQLDEVSRKFNETIRRIDKTFRKDIRKIVFIGNITNALTFCDFAEDFPNLQEIELPSCCKRMSPYDKPFAGCEKLWRVERYNGPCKNS